MILHEPTLAERSLDVNDLAMFTVSSDAIIVNSYGSYFDDVDEKVYTRYLFHRDLM